MKKAQHSTNQEDIMANATDKKDWQYEVANGDTVLGFAEWLEHRAESQFGRETSSIPFKLTGSTIAVRNRQRIEQEIARAAVVTLLDAGFSLGVNDGEEIVLHHSTDVKAILNALFNTDGDYLYVYDMKALDYSLKDETPDYWVRFVYGNDGWDVMSDYSNVDHLDKYLGDGTAVQKLIDKYSG